MQLLGRETRLLGERMIRCLGLNENKIPPHEFQRLFHTECMKVGRVVRIIFLQGQIGAAYVEEHSKRY